MHACLRSPIEPLEARIAPAFGAVIELSGLNGINGFKISGVMADDHSGISVSAAGDVNGDGFGDLIIGADLADPNGSSSGASYVVFGKMNGFAAELNLSTLDGSNGFKLSGVAAYDRSGISVSAAGDVNGDGFDDLIIGALRADPNGSDSGASYVVFGKASGFAANLNLSTLDGSNGFKVSGVAALDFSGASVSAAGDVNGDGFGDLIIGAYFASPNGVRFAGASYVVFGKAGGFAANVNLSTLDGGNGFKLSGVADGDSSGDSVSAAGDVNGDGFDDVIIGAANADPNGYTSGVSYVVFGKASGFAANVNLSTLDGGNGFKLTGVAAGDNSGASVSAAGDVNGDGFGDLIIGADLADPNGDRSGASYVVFGKASGFAANLNLSILDGGNGFKLSGVAAGDQSGHSVSAAGDVNGDGFDDLIIGAVLADSNGTDSGVSYVVFGKARGFAAELNLSTLDGGNGFKLSGVAAGDQCGWSVSAAGDVNSDGFGDLIVGAVSGIDLGGASYVIFGRGVELSVSDASANEGDAGTTALQFTVSLSETGINPVSVNVTTANGSALVGSDYSPFPTAIVTFAPGETSKTVTIDVIGDTLFETDESLSIALSAATGGVIGDAIGTGTIRNDDAPPRVAIAGGSVLEGDFGTTSLVFAVSLSTASGLPTTVQFASADGTALADSDYTALTPGMLSFAAGETTKSISVAVLSDTNVEAHETFSIVLSSPTNATIANDTGTGTILNDDTLLRINDAAALEGHTGTHGMTFTVSLSAPTALPVSVTVATADGTATAGSDYVALTPGTLDFEPGETSKTVTVDVMGDTVVEPSETFSIVLSAATNAFIDHAAAVGTILDDDVALGGKRVATFTDVDGDLVTIKVSKGMLKVEDFTLFPSGNGAQLAVVDFSGQTELAGANLSVTAKRAVGTPGGDRVVDVGYVNATGLDLGKVMITGDLGQIDAGNDLDPRPGLLSLSARSLGNRGLDTQLPGGSLQSEIAGSFKTLKLADGMQDATLSVSGDLGTIAIKGSVLGSAIRSDGKIRAMKISGDLAASATSDATITARGTLLPASDAKALAIGTLSIGGSVDHAEILAGYDRTGAAVNADAALGRVTVGGNWTASDLTAGVSSGADGMFGTDDDVLIPGGNQIIAKIASVVIKGAVSGIEGGTDHFGFVAQQFASFSSGGVRLTLLPGPSNDLTGLPVGATGSVKVREAA